MFISPLCWGVIDLRAEKISPCPNHPRANEFFSDIEVQRLQRSAIEIVNNESKLNPSAMELLEILRSSTFNLKKINKEKRARGIEGICSLLRIDDKSLNKVNIYDQDTQYIGESLDAL